MMEDGTVTMTPGAFMSLAKEVSERDVRIAKLEWELKMESEKRKALEVQLLEQQSRVSLLEEEKRILKEKISRAVCEATYFPHYIVLSVEKIINFAKCIKDIEKYCLLHTFIVQVLPEDMKTQELPRIDEILVKPQIEPGVTLNQPTFNGPMYDVTGNNQVNLGNAMSTMNGTEKGGAQNDGKEE